MIQEPFQTLIVEDDSDLEIVKIIRLAKNLGLSIIAEGPLF